MHSICTANRTSPNFSAAGAAHLHKHDHGPSMVTAALAWGDAILVVDDLRVRGGGYLLQSAHGVDQRSVSFMAVNARGLICLVVDEPRREVLGLTYAPQRGGHRHQGRLCVSVESSTGVSTGISAADRAQTIRAAARAQAQPRDLIQPGHVFPLVPRGPLTAYAGMAEVAAELSAWVTGDATAVVCQVLDEAGELADEEHLLALADRFELPVIRTSEAVRMHCQRNPLLRQGASVQEWIGGRKSELIRYTSGDASDELLVSLELPRSRGQARTLHCLRGLSSFDLLKGGGRGVAAPVTSQQPTGQPCRSLSVMQMGQTVRTPQEDTHAALVTAIRCAQICRDLGTTSLSAVSDWLSPFANEFALQGIAMPELRPSPISQQPGPVRPAQL